MSGRQAGGDLLVRVLDFVTACRQDDPLGEYPHVGDIQWWFRDAALEDTNLWCFWVSAQGSDVAVGLTIDDEIVCLVHPQARGTALDSVVRAWARERLAEQARQQRLDRPYTIREDVADDNPDKIALLEQEGFTRGDWSYLRHTRMLSAPLPSPQLPDGFTLRHVAGDEDLDARAALHRDSFYPYTSATLEESTALYRRAMRMPGYDPHLDVVVVAPDGTFAAGCILWMDGTTKVGLVEPLGTRPDFRRRALATAVVLEGLHQLQARGMTRVLATGISPGEGCAIPPAFTSSRFVFQALGFTSLRTVFRYSQQQHVS